MPLMNQVSQISSIRGSRILVADDAPPVRRFLAAQLTSLGAKVTVASDGLEVLDSLAAESVGGRVPFALVLLDLTMPRLDGAATLRQMRARADWREVPVVVITASHNRDAILDVVQVGIQGCVLKPFETHRLIEMVELALQAGGHHRPGDEAPAASRTQEMAGPPPSCEDGLAGQTVGGCRLLRKLGQGGMGTVYLAEQLALGRPVAVKLLNPRQGCTEAEVQRFEREARMAARLDHPNVVSVFDHGDDGGTHYMVCEYVAGETVATLIRRQGALAPELALDIAIQTCRGLLHAQSLGLVHRDIKPDNLIRQPDGTIRITDFGLARHVEGEPALTKVGVVLGTPVCMSPEQARGRPLDSRSDIYSLGVTLYWMLTGVPPFSSGNTVDLLLKHLTEERPDPCALNPKVSAALGAEVRRMMAVNREARPASAGELLAALKAVAKALVEAAAPPCPAAPRRGRPATVSDPALGTASQVMKALLALPDRRALLAVYMENVGACLERVSLQRELGWSAARLAAALGVFTATGLVQEHPEGRLACHWPSDDPALQSLFDQWQERFGRR